MLYKHGNCYFIYVSTFGGYMFLRLLFALLSLLHGVSFSMVLRYKNKEEKERIERSARKCIDNIKSIETHEAWEERKRWESLPQKQQDLYKLERLYEKQDNPNFVTRYLKNQKVPLLLLNISKEIFIINPYNESFYRNSDKQTFTKETEIIRIGHVRIETIKSKFPSCVELKNSLVGGVFFGRDEDIKKEFEKLDTLCKDNAVEKHGQVFDAIICAIKFTCLKNNALELLLEREKKLSAQWTNYNQRCNWGYTLLIMVVKDKKIFELVANKDPYNSHRIMYNLSLSEEMLTHLDRMKKIDKDIFDREHIDIFIRDGGGMTVAEVEDMWMVNRILQGKPTPEEIFMNQVWIDGIEICNSNHSNKYLESQRIAREHQMREEAARVMNDIIIQGLRSLAAVRTRAI